MLYYLRFIHRQKNEFSHRSRGIFDLAYDLVEEESLSRQHHEDMKNHIDWFDKHLTEPSVFEGKKSERALSWFKASAEEMITRVREMRLILEQHSYSIEMLKTDRPGKILYEDEHQIVAIPFRDNRDLF